MNKRTYIICLAIVLLSGLLYGQEPDQTFHAPELAGTLRLGLIQGNESLWASEGKVKTTREGNTTVYTVKNKLTGKGHLTIRVRPLKDTQGSVIRVEAHDLPQGTELGWGYGGAGGEKAPETNEILPAHCKDNVYSIEGHAFTLYYGTSRSLRIFNAIAPLGSEIRLSDARQLNTPLTLWQSGKKTDAPALAARCPITNDVPVYFCFYKHSPKADYNYYMLPELYANGSIPHKNAGEWMKSTPD